MSPSVVVGGMADPIEQLFTYVFGWLMAAGVTYGGYAVIRRGFELRRQRQLIRDTPTEEVESVSMGPSELAGTARPHDGTLTAPFSEVPCLLARWRVEEYRDDGDDDGGSWRTIASGLESVPFVLDDGTGRLLVEPHDDVEFAVSEEPRLDVDVDETPPDRVAAFLAEQDVPVEPQDWELLEGVDFGTEEGDRRYYQELLQPGEHVYVFGTVQPDEAAPDGVAVRKVTDGSRAEPLFLLGDKPAAEIAADRKWALWRLPAGGALVTVGVLGLGYMVYWTLSGALAVLDAVTGVVS